MASLSKTEIQGALRTLRTTDAAFKSALIARLAVRAPVVEGGFTLRNRRWAIGVGPRVIDPGALTVITVERQRLFRGEKIVNTGDVTGLYIVGLYVGDKAQMPLLSPVAVATFEGSVLDNELYLDTCDVGLRMAFQVQNFSAVPRTFAATVIGQMMERW